MALSKHDSMVVSEIISAFGVIALFSISIMLFLIYGELNTKKTSSMFGQKTAQEARKIAITDLDPALLNEINKSFAQIDDSQKNANQQFGFFMGKLIEKQFSEEEIVALQAELKAAQEAQAAAIKKAQAEQAAGQNPEAAAPENAPAQ